MTVYESLGMVQAALKAPKNQRNQFGGYNYRSCEDILEAVKPLLKDAGAVLALTDEVLQVGERYYVVATAVFYAEGDSVAAQGWAREADTRKGMDESQITGSASSYARKYALNGLFLIDDTKDADATNAHGKAADSGKKPTQERLIKPTVDALKQAKAALFEAVKAYAEREGLDAQTIAKGIKERPDYDGESLEFMARVTEEFENA